MERETGKGVCLGILCFVVVLLRRKSNPATNACECEDEAEEVEEPLALPPTARWMVRVTPRTFIFEDSYRRFLPRLGDLIRDGPSK